MPAQLTSALDRLKTLVGQFSIAQRTLTIIGVAGLVIGGIFVTSYLTKPAMSPLFSGVSSADASAIVDLITGEGVPYQLTDGGRTIMVPQKQLYATRLKVAAAGLPAATDGAGYSLLDKMSMTSSEFQQQTTYQRAMEGEFAKTIASIDGVEAASVKLAMPKETVFVSTKADPTASVFVQTARGTSLDADQVQSIVHLVSAGVQGMKPTDVAVIDSNGHVLSAVGGTPGGGTSDQQTGNYEQRVTASVQAMLDRVVGPGKAVVTVNAELNLDNTDKTSEVFTAPTKVPALSSATTTEKFTGSGGTPVGGVLGPDNLSVPSGSVTSGTGNYTKTSENLNPAVNKVTERTTTTPGSVRRQSVSVVVDQATGAALNMTDLTAQVTAAAGVDATRGDTVAVTRMAFDTQSAKDAKAALGAATKQEKAAAQLSLIKSGAIALAILAILVVALISSKKRSKLARRQALDLGELQIVTEAPQQLPFAAHTPLSLPASLPKAGEAELKRSEISALANERPDEVADLLRGWLVDSAER
ncbi:flagellar basal-body MS-ring/collar protein FliF [Pengzhenrongella sp.]|jgi:flagellar M-ring protein FliF|uniref:flagellar basal-body MS-ring/collar protein FliF n=1 Tax=Pengzhenrongella sp. TaxID=2888820 RepID=UPI002F94561B